MLMRSAAQSLTEQLAERFAARIRDRLLAPGSRLPSVRANAPPSTSSVPPRWWRPMTSCWRRV
jgi:hypothetical protein